MKNNKDRDSYFIGDTEFSRDEFLSFVQKNENIAKRGQITGINGPFDGKINSIYHFETKSSQDFIMRARISKAFRYEGIIKEKILFPFLDGKLSAETPNLGDEVKKITEKKTGSYVFKESPLKPVDLQSLLYYDETKNEIDYIYAFYDYLRGQSIYYPLESDRTERPFLISTMKYKDIFRNMGKVLAQLHSIHFDGFYSDIREIGQPEHKKLWSELFQEQMDKEMTEAKQHDAIAPLIPKLEKFFTDRKPLVADEKEPVLFHNDFQSQNILVREYEQEFELKGVIDFDNWRIGPPAQDFVKIQYWTIQGDETLNNALFDGYCSLRSTVNPKEMQQKIDIYKMLWFVLVYNFEMDKVMKNELNDDVDQRFPAADKYLAEMKKILNKVD